MSHDLRTPLAAVRAVVSAFLSGAPYATRAELLTLVGDEVERLDRLVANPLSLSGIEAGAPVQVLCLHPTNDTTTSVNAAAAMTPAAVNPKKVSNHPLRWAPMTRPSRATRVRTTRSTGARKPWRTAA